MAEYYNKEYYNQIKGNCAYIELNPENIKKVMRALYDSGINFSASYGGYRNTVTVANEDRARAMAIADNYRFGTNKAGQQIIGNTDYSSIRDRNYINTDSATAFQVAAILSGDSSIRFSGVIRGDKATITVSGRKNADMVNRIIDNVRNADILNALSQAGFERLPDNNGFVVIRNTATDEAAGFRNMNMVRDMWNDPNNEFFHAPVYAVDKTVDTDNPFYISETDGQTERSVYVDDNMTAPVFAEQQEAESYAAEKNIPLAQPEAEEAPPELSESDEPEIKGNPVIDTNLELIESFEKWGNSYPDVIYYDERAESFTWLKYDEDAAPNGALVEKTFTEDDVFAAYNKSMEAENEVSARDMFVSVLNDRAEKGTILVNDPAFTESADIYTNMPVRGEALSVYDIYEGSTSVTNVENFIGYLEKNTAAVRNDKERREQEENKAALISSCYDKLKEAVFVNAYVKNAMEDTAAEHSIAVALAAAETEATRIFNEDIYGNIDFYADFFGREKSENRKTFEEYVTDTIRKEFTARGSFAHSQKNETVENAADNTVYPENSFEYGGYHFVPVDGEAVDFKSADFKTATRNLVHDSKINLSVYSSTYNYDDFYKVSGDNPANIFECVETGKKYIPGDNELFEYTGEIDYSRQIVEENPEIPAEDSPIHFGLLGNGITVYDTSREVNHDYPIVAHISVEGIITYYDKYSISDSDIQRIEEQAAQAKREFTEEWNKLDTANKYEKLLDGMTLKQSVGMRNLGLSADEAIKAFEHSIIFKDEPFPDINILKEKYAPEQTRDNSANLQETLSDETISSSETKKKKISNTNAHRIFKELNKRFPDIMSKAHSHEHYDSNSFEPLSVEWIGGNNISVMQTYTQYGDLMRDPDVVLHIDFENETANAISFENSGMGIYNEYENGSQGQRETNSYMLKWFEALDGQGHYLTRATAQHRFNDDVYDIDLKFKDGKIISVDSTDEAAQDYIRQNGIEIYVPDPLTEIGSPRDLKTGDVISYEGRAWTVENTDFDDTEMIYITANDNSGDRHAFYDSEIISLLEKGGFSFTNVERNNMPENNTPDNSEQSIPAYLVFGVGDYIRLNKKIWEVTSVGSTINFKNFDKSDPDQEFSYNGGIDSFFEENNDKYRVLSKAEINSRTKIAELEATEGNSDIPDTVILSFNNGGRIWFSESSSLNDFWKAQDNISFALGNAIIEYLDNKQYIESEIPELNTGVYHKTDFCITYSLNGEVSHYNGRYDIGDGAEDGGGSLIDHIRFNAEYNLKNEYSTDEDRAEAQEILDVFIPFLEKHTELTAEEQRIFDDYKAANPIRVEMEQEETLESDRSNVTVDDLKVGDVIKQEDGIWKITAIDGDFSASFENTDKTALNSVKSSIGHWKRNLENEGFEYIPQNEVVVEAEKTEQAVDTQEAPAAEEISAAPAYRDVPLYTMPIWYAKENNEIELFRKSDDENRECVDCIVDNVSKSYSDYRFNSESALNAVLAIYPAERVEYVVAVNIADMKNDGRISRANLEWAENYINGLPEDFRKVGSNYITIHAGLLNMFAETTRKYMEQYREQKVNSLNEQLKNKFKTELDDFLANPHDASEYQINMKKDIADFIIGSDSLELSEVQYQTLLSRPHVLAELYEEWRSNDIDEWDEEVMRTFISETATSIAESIERNSESPALAQAKAYIREYLDTEFSSTESFSDLHHVSIGYTDLGENNEYPYQVEADLVDFKMTYYLANEIISTEQYDSIDEMNEKALSLLDFNDLIAVGNNVLDERNPDDVAKALDLYRNHITFSVISIEGEKPVVIGKTYVDSEDITDLDEYQDYILKTGKKYADVTVEYYDIGNDEGNESYPAEDGEANYIQEHLTEVLNHSGCIILETNNFSVQTPDYLLDEYEMNNLSEEEKEERGYTVRESEDNEQEQDEYDEDEPEQDEYGLTGEDWDFINEQITVPAGHRRISDDDAIAMWENGVTVYDYEGNALPATPTDEQEKAAVYADLFTDYGRADDLFTAKAEDVAIFRIAERIASDIWDMNRIFNNVPNEVGQPYFLSLENDHEEWENYKDGLNEYQNTLNALYSGDFYSVENYLENVIASQDIDDDTREKAEKALEAVSDFREQSGIDEVLPSLFDEEEQEQETSPLETAFEKLKANHDEIPEITVNILERAKAQMEINHYSRLEPDVFKLPQFASTYGSLDRIDNRYFNGKLKNFISELNGYLSEAERDSKNAAEQTTGKYTVLLVKDGNEYRRIRFTGFEELKRQGHYPGRENMDEVYSGNISDLTDSENTTEILEAIYAKLNNKHPADYHNRSLSVGDVILLETETSKSAYMINTMGVVDVSDYFFDIEKEKIDLAKMRMVTLIEQYRGDTGYRGYGENLDGIQTIYKTVTFTDFNSERISRNKEQTTTDGELLINNDPDVGDSTVTRQAMLDELNAFLDSTRTNGYKKIEIIDSEHNKTYLDGIRYEFVVGDEKTRTAEPQGQKPAEPYTPKLGDTFKDKQGRVWELVSLTGVLPWYTDQCAIQSYDENSRIVVGKNETYTNLLDTDKYERIVKEPVISDYTPKIGDMIEMNDELLTISDISDNIITFTETESLFGNTSRMTVLDFLSSDFSVYSERDNAVTEDGQEEAPVELSDEAEQKPEDEALDIKNLAQLKRALVVGAEFVITAAARSETVNQLRRVNYADTTGIYSIRPDAPYDEKTTLANKGRGSYLEWGKSADWSFSNGSCTAYVKGAEHTDENIILTIKVKPPVIERERENKGKYDFKMKRYEIITYDEDSGTDEKTDHDTLEEAREKAEEYLKDDYRGYAIFNTETKIIEAVGGNFPTERAFSPEVLRVNGFVREADEMEERMKALDTISEAESKTKTEKKQEGSKPYTYDLNDPDPSKVKLRSIVIDISGKSPSYDRPEPETPAEKPRNFVITDENLGVNTPKARYKANIAAIKTLNAIEAENRTATPEEQQILSGYTGWGAIPQVFDSSNKEWSKEYQELRELLTDEEYTAARKSTMNAHYTSPVVINAIYEGLAGIGFEKGKILEPAMGIGNFFGAMPEAMRGSELHGVELDGLTGRIAKQLYPNADIQITGYEHTKFENGSFDVVVGNVPFGDYSVNDRDYNKHKFRIHDYFIAKSIDKLRPGGVLAVVTSKGTMDKESDEMRKYIAQQAELLGAIRLPNNAFKANAGTEVTSDILFFQKRERPIEINPDEVEWLSKAETAEGLSVNNYFIQHPDMVMGKIVEGNKLYAIQKGETSCIATEGADLKTKLAEAVKKIKGHYTAVTRSKPKKQQEAEDRVPAPPNSRKFSYYAVNGTVYYREDGSYMDKAKIKGESLKRALAMIEIRDNIRELLDLQLNNADTTLDERIAESRAKLNERYDAFVKQYGHFDDRKNTRILKGDDGYNLLIALEDKDKEGNYVKADIFSHDTVKPNNIITHVDTAEDALILSVAEKAKVDFEYMTELSGMDKETLIKELEGQIYRLPQEEEKYVTADEYLTGNIRTKLRELDNAPADMDVSKHREALTAAIPKRIEAKDISVRLGAHWIDPKFISQFIREKFNPSYRSHIEVQYSKASGRWKIEGATNGDRSGYTATNEFGTKRRDAYEILEGLLNHEDLTVKDNKLDENGREIRDSNGNYVKVTNTEETKAVQAVVKRIEREWQDWVFKDPERRETLVDKYNEVFNSIRHREYDGSHLNFVGINTDITLREHQRNAIARALYGGNTMLAHAVGAGKSATRS